MRKFRVVETIEGNNSEIVRKLDSASLKDPNRSIAENEKGTFESGHPAQSNASASIGVIFT